MGKKFQVAIVGTGPAALMAAEVVSSSGIQVSIFEKRKTPARKLLIAGSSGLNVAHETPTDQLFHQYSGSPNFWKNIFHQFPPEQWLSFIHQLGLKTFKGTSHRYFVEGMKAGKLVALWKKRLTQKKVTWHFDHEVVNFKKLTSHQIQLLFHHKPTQTFDAAIFCLGGASWEPVNEPISWPEIFQSKKISIAPFTPSNVGFNVDWSRPFLNEAEGHPLKNVLLTTPRGFAQGDIVITRYGLEGTPVYTVGTEGDATFDLKPDLNLKQLFEKISRVKENLAPIRKVQKQLKLCPATLALLYHETPDNELKDIKKLIQRIKCFPVTFKSRQNLEWAISSAGGLKLSELNSSLMVKKFPGVFAAGEMLDWDTITGGFLIQACVSQGFCAGQGVLDYLGRLR